MATPILPQTTRVAIYARFPTGQGQDVTCRLAELAEVAEARGLTVIGEYVDEGVSARRIHGRA